MPTPNATAVEELIDVNGPFQPSSTTRFLRIQADCTFDRSFAAPAPNPSAPSTALQGIAPPGIYYVRVHAINAAGPGPASNEVIVNVP